MKKNYLHYTHFCLLGITLFLLNACVSNRLTRVAYNRVSGAVVTYEKKTYEGTFILPGGAFANKIVITLAGGDEKVSLDARDIDYIVAWNEKMFEKKYKFVYRQVMIPQVFSKKTRLTGEYVWMNVLGESPSINIYMGAADFKINDNGALTYYTPRDANGASGYLQTPKKEHPVYVGPIRSEGTIVLIYTDVLADDPDLLEHLKANTKGYPRIGVEELMIRYNPQK